MAKLKDTPITVQDIDEYLSTQDDFGLELAVYHRALEIGLLASHGGMYEDPSTKKFRQYDIRVVAQRGNRRIALAIECKSLKTYFPLVISRIPRSREEGFHNFIYSRAPNQGSFVPGMQRDDAQSMLVRDQAGIYPAGRLVGKSTVQVGRNERNDFVANDADTFDKWSQALSSAHDLVSDSLLHHKISTRRGFVTAVLPILVVANDALWVADYAEDGTASSPPFNVDEATVYLGREYSVGFHTKFVATHLHVYTRRGIIRFLEGLVWADSTWNELFPHGAVPLDVDDA
jgi:hypothetical protein